jgi:hypothetical protein
MSAREVTEWAAYETIFGPLGAQRIDYLAAMLAERITSMLQMSGKPRAIKEFVPKWDREEIIDRGQSPQSHDPTRD